MPKELTHWALAERVRDRFSGTRAGEIISRHINLYYLGAVSPDFPYYYLAGRGRERFSAAADRLHGRFGGNTLAFLPSVIRMYDGRSEPDDVPEPVIAFLLGAVCHVTTDWNFHPLVYYFCGSRKSNDPAVARGATERHQELEARLDLLYLREYAPVNHGRVGNSFRGVEIGRRDLLLLLERFLFPGEGIRHAELRRLIRTYTMVQGAFFSRLVGSVAAALGNRYLQSLTYSAIRAGEPRLLDRPVRFRNPASGEEREESFRGLERKMIADASDLFDLVERYLRRDAVIGDLEGLPGLHLETGLPSDDDRRMRFFRIVEPREILPS